MPAFLCFWGEFLKAFLKIAQIAFQKHSSEDGWSSWWKYSRTEVVVSIISVMDANQLMFIYLQQSNVTFENNQNDCFCQLVTHNTPLSIWSWNISKWLKPSYFPLPLTSSLPPTPISKSLALLCLRPWTDLTVGLHLPTQADYTVHCSVLSVDRSLAQLLF